MILFHENVSSVYNCWWLNTIELTHCKVTFIYSCPSAGQNFGAPPTVDCVKPQVSNEMKTTCQQQQVCCLRLSDGSECNGQGYLDIAYTCASGWLIISSIILICQKNINVRRLSVKRTPEETATKSSPRPYKTVDISTTSSSITATTNTYFLDDQTDSSYYSTSTVAAMDWKTIVGISVGAILVLLLLLAFLLQR